MCLHKLSNYLWYTKNYWYLLLLPLSFLYGICIKIRAALYKYNIISHYKAAKPVIIVGNITVGGTGKTPLIIYLAQLLIAQGIKPGILAHGYGGKCGNQIVLMQQNTTVEIVNIVGDEAYLLSKNLAVPIVVSRIRVNAAKILSMQNIDVILSDDGLQHYALQRDLEILLIDGQRKFGNGNLLPAGPLRESKNRLSDVDFIIENGVSEQYFSMALQPNKLKPVLASLPDIYKPPVDGIVHAVAGIANPERFFTLLEQLGFKIIRHVFPDHYNFKKEDLNFSDNLSIIMTEKDAVKCICLAGEKHWYLPVTAEVTAGFAKQFLNKVKHLRSKSVR